MPQDIPWGYGHDRVTGMVVDPDRLYVYWEVTDDAIEAARAGLGPSGADAWLNLRVYDITGRLFDGTNAHSYFDHSVERHERQWFFAINKPTSTACVEIGLKSAEGYFVKIARSGRVDFPRREPVGGGAVEWLSVRGASGPVGGAFTGAPGRTAPRTAARRRGCRRRRRGGPGGGGPRWRRRVAGLDAVRRLPDPGRPAAVRAALGHGTTAPASSGPANGRAPSGWARCCAASGKPARSPTRRSPVGQRRVPRTTARSRCAPRAGARTSSTARGRSSFAASARAPSGACWDHGSSAARSRSRRRRAHVRGGAAFALGSSEWMALGASERAWLGASELLFAAPARCGCWAPARSCSGGASEPASWAPASSASAAPASACWRRQRAAPGRRDRAHVRGRQREHVRGGQRAHARRRQRVHGRQRALHRCQRKGGGGRQRRRRRAPPSLANVPRKGVGDNHGDRLLLTGSARPPPLRPPSRRSDGDGGAVALRGDHRHVPAAAPDVRGPDRRSRPLPMHGVAVGAAHHDAHRRPAQAPLRRAPRQADRAHRKRDRTHQARAALPAAGAHVPRPLPVAAPHLAQPRRRSGARVPAAAGGRARRGHHVDRDARVLPAHGSQLGQHPRPGPRRRRPVREHFGHRPRGMWLGECGFVPGVDELLREAAIRYFFVDTHGVLFADRRPVYGVYAPVYCPSGVAAFGRDMESSEQVWSAKEGYPGDRHYRDFYRDIGFDLPMEYIKPYIHPEGHRVYTGIKYHAITHNQLHDKWVYDPDIARGKAGLHASHFRGNREKQVQRLRGAHGPPADHRQPVRRRAVRPLVVRRADLPRRRVPPAALRSERRRDDHPRRLPGPPRHQPGRDAVRVVVGRQGLQRLLAERDQRLDVPPPARRRRAHGGAGAPPPERRRADARAR